MDAAGSVLLNGFKCSKIIDYSPGRTKHTGGFFCLWKWRPILPALVFSTYSTRTLSVTVADNRVSLLVLTCMHLMVSYTPSGAYAYKLTLYYPLTSFVPLAVQVWAGLGWDMLTHAGGAGRTFEESNDRTSRHADCEL